MKSVNLTSWFVRWVWVVTGLFAAVSVWFLPDYGVAASACVGWLLFAARSIQLERTAAFSSVMWNPWNKVVQCHRDGTILPALTNIAREERGLPVPWTPELADPEVRQPPEF